MFLALFKRADWCLRITSYCLVTTGETNARMHNNELSELAQKYQHENHGGLISTQLAFETITRIPASRTLVMCKVEEHRHTVCVCRCVVQALRMPENSRLHRTEITTRLIMNRLKHINLAKYSVMTSILLSQVIGVVISVSVPRAQILRLRVPRWHIAAPLLKRQHREHSLIET